VRGGAVGQTREAMSGRTVGKPLGLALLRLLPLLRLRVLLRSLSLLRLLSLLNHRDVRRVALTGAAAGTAAATV